MQETGKDKIKTEHFRISVAKNGGLKPIRVTGDVPPEFCKLEPDSKKIREALNNGELQFAPFEERVPYRFISLSSLFSVFSALYLG